MAKSPLQVRHIKNLEWAILLSKTNLDECTEGDWLKIKEGLYAFIYWVESGELFSWQTGEGKEMQSRKGYKGGVAFIPMSKEIFVNYITKDSLRDILASFRDCFGNIAGGMPFYHCQAGSAIILVQPSIPSKQFIRSTVLLGTETEKDFIQKAQITLAEHLAESGITYEQIRSCPECHKIFLLNMKPRKDRNFYCSTRCSRNAATRAYRKRNEEELKVKEQKRSRRRYVEKQKKQYGPNVNVKVARKPRKAKGAYRKQ